MSDLILAIWALLSPYASHYEIPEDRQEGCPYRIRVYFHKHPYSVEDESIIEWHATHPKILWDACRSMQRLEVRHANSHINNKEEG